MLIRWAHNSNKSTTLQEDVYIDETLDEFQKRTRNADKGSRRIKTKEKSIQEKVASIMKDNIDGTGVDTKAKENKNVGK